MGKTSLSEAGGFTPGLDHLVKQIGPKAAIVYGRVWRFCQADGGVCYASLQRIGRDVGMGRASVMRHLRRLCRLGYLTDLTPGFRNRPHRYADTGKAWRLPSPAGVARAAPEP